MRICTESWSWASSRRQRQGPLHKSCFVFQRWCWTRSKTLSVVCEDWKQCSGKHLCLIRMKSFLSLYPSSVYVHIILTGHSLPWSDYLRLSSPASPSPRWQGDHCREYVMAFTYWAGPVRSPDSRTLSWACRERRPTAFRGEAPWLVSLFSCHTLLSLLDDTIHRLPKTLHPMTQLGIGVAALNHDSVFQAAYEKGMKKKEYWAHTLDDCINLIAKLPALAARIYRNVYHPENQLPSIDKNLDLVGMYSELAFCKIFVQLWDSTLTRKLFCHDGLWRQ